MNRSERIHDVETRKKAAFRDGHRRTHDLWCNGEWKKFEVWRVPVDALTLNVDNKRFGATRTLVEQGLGRTLDPENDPVDELSIISILLDQSLKIDMEGVSGTASKDYLALREDWHARQQAEPLWIRPDGTVRNGNRRLAMIKRERALHGAASINEWVEVIIIDPAHVDEKELFRMEQNEQLAENFKKRYDRIDRLLALREAAELEGIDWADPASLDRVAGILKHFAGKDDKRYAITQLRAIRAIDAYLDYLGQPGQYHYVMQERQVEVFREVGRILQLGDEYADDISDLTLTAFAAVQAGATYNDIRSMRKLFTEDREEFLRVAGQIGNEEERAGWPPDSDTETEIAVVDPEVLTAEENEEDPPVPPATALNYPKKAVLGHIQRAVDRVSTAGLDVAAQLQQARDRLEAVTEDRLREAMASAVTEDISESLRAIVAWAAHIRATSLGGTSVEE
ncbi:hypothetical protein Aph01nite_68030 [Acrocarpospora phusangensis]|uniref:ParB/Sulfiredoxin domain-containing protein n=1 Tax=Acrocarpospora phusangensis TaxID=1070424 RepID=A0A919QGQ7_9ACTN|nr:hypothetical protein [Acrocarpospora phusangensis]GIH28493.1 hypothetical protein Aph01nite_68030 [Acrocarpospora phusangensis]